MTDSEPTQAAEDVKPEPGTEGAESVTHLNLKVKAQVCALSRPLGFVPGPLCPRFLLCYAKAVWSTEMFGLWFRRMATSSFSRQNVPLLSGARITRTLTLTYQPAHLLHFTVPAQNNSPRPWSAVASYSPSHSYNAIRFVLPIATNVRIEVCSGITMQQLAAYWTICDGAFVSWQEADEGLL